MTGVPPSSDRMPLPLWSLIEQAARRWPEEPMLMSRQGDRATFGQYRDRVLAMAAGLADLGIGRGDVVSWILPTWVDTVVLAGALSRLGAVQNPIIGIYRHREVGFCARQAGSKYLISPAIFSGFDYGAMAAEIAEDLNGLMTLSAGPGSFPQGDPATLPAAASAGSDEVRWICYTSGTTADPKGAMHSDQTVGAFGGPMAERLDVQPGDRYSLTFPFPHIGGIGLLFMALERGCTHLLDETVDPEATVRFLSEQGCTHAGTGTPFYLMYLAAQQKLDRPLFGDLKVCPGGGAPIPPAIHRRVVAELGGVGVASGWGLTEAPVLTNGAVDDPDEKLASTEGRALPGVDLITVADDGTPCAPGAEGELRAKGRQVMLGYMDSSLDSEAFDSGGYYRTGDLGIIDADGYVTITGRLKDIIIRHGENISAKEVEDLLFGLDGIADAAVIGLPDERTGESVCAVVVPAGGARVTLKSLAAALAEAGLRRQATPERLEIVDALPRNPAGKVLKRELQRQFGPSGTQD
ncbi:MAG: AMP-binding protein [Acidimicrobiaceae bacterium]|nr:AMP-binding protein [Acidimicrobiaceae bacterium]MXZ95734.1 AMP-binding protein [Acidimicrobiaceae bacterium]MYF42105.1 AMP-binding protein [Acidimicrobiaceae bacterium]